MSSRRLIALLPVIALLACRAPTGRPAEPRHQALPAAEPPCPWGGVWDATLRRGTRTVHGTLTVVDSAGPRREAGRRGRTMRRWRGHYSFDEGPLYGADEGGVQSTTVRPHDSTQAERALYLEGAGARVTIALRPELSHGPLSLWGVHRGDTITGEWVQRADALPPLPRGTFTLVRRTACHGA